jgi:ParB family chromosome partitioning protein
VLAILGFDEAALTVADAASGEAGLVRLFPRLLDLPDAVVMEVIAIVMGETLASGSAAVEAVGLHIGIDIADWWQADDALFDLIRDREALFGTVAEGAGHGRINQHRDAQYATCQRRAVHTWAHNGQPTGEL